MDKIMVTERDKFFINTKAIELAAVFLIVAVLASIILVGLSKYINDNKTITVKTNLTALLIKSVNSNKQDGLSVYKEPASLLGFVALIKMNVKVRQPVCMPIDAAIAAIYSKTQQHDMVLSNFYTQPTIVFSPLIL